MVGLNDQDQEHRQTPGHHVRTGSGLEPIPITHFFALPRALLARFFGSYFLGGPAVAIFRNAASNAAGSSSHSSSRATALNRSIWGNPANGGGCFGFAFGADELRAARGLI